VYFLHGALHLVVSGSGVTWKLRRREIQSVLDQFGEPITGDPVSERTHRAAASAVEQLNGNFAARAQRCLLAPQRL
jgi:hypothetical protein